MAMKPIADIACLVLMLLSSFMTAAYPHKTSRRRRRRLDRASFVATCTEELLSEGAKADGIISEAEFADFLSNLCVSEGVCSPGTNLDFHELKFRLQLSFVYLVCEQDTMTPEEQRECLTMLDTGEEVYGYTIAPEAQGGVDVDIVELCSSLYRYAGAYIAAETNAPTLPPVLPVTLDPTLAPTLLATLSPSAAPIAVTATPTIAPVVVTTTGAPITAAPSITIVTEAPNQGEISATPMPTTLAPTPSPDLMVGGESEVETLNTEDGDGLSTGLVAVISVAGVLFLLGALFVVGRQRRKTRKPRHRQLVTPAHLLDGDGSIFTEDSRAMKFATSSSVKSIPSIKSLLGGASSRGSQDSMRPGQDHLVDASAKEFTQFDPAAAAAIPLFMRDESDAKSLSSASSRGRNEDALHLPPGMSVESPKKQKMNDLDEAIARADWKAVAGIATSISGSEDLSSSMSGVSSTGQAIFAESLAAGDSDRSSGGLGDRTMLGETDEARAIQLDELIEQSNWDDVALAAAGFAKEDGEGGTSPKEAPTKRSFIDFVTGRRPSSAVEAASGADAFDTGVVREASSPSDVETGADFVGLVGPVGTLETIPSGSFEKSSPDRAGIESQRAAIATEPSEAEPKRARKGGWRSMFRRGKTDQDQDASHKPTIFNLDSSDSDYGMGEMSIISGTSYQEGGSTDVLSISVLKAQLEIALAREDWKAVEQLSSQIEAVNPIPENASSEAKEDTLATASRSAIATVRSADSEDANILSLRQGLDGAIDSNDWKQVEIFSKQILASSIAPSKRSNPVVLTDDQKVPELASIQDEYDASTQATPTSKQTSVSSTGTPDKNKIRTIETMIQAGNWRGVTALAAVLDLETSSLSSPNERTSSLADQATFRPTATDWNWANVLSPPSIRRSLNDDAFDYQSTEWAVSQVAGSGETGRLQPRPVTPHSNTDSSASTEENITLRVIEKLVQEEDWTGLADFAGRDPKDV